MALSGYPAPVEWHLYVDESGSFDPRGRQPQACVAMGGVLAAAGALDKAECDAAFLRVAPELPYPLHSRLLNPLAFHLAVCATKTSCASDCVCSTRPDVAEKQRIVASFRRKEEPRGVDWTRLQQRTLIRGKGAKARSKSAITDAEAEAAALLSKSGAHMVFASETTPYDAGKPDGEGRYLELLRVLADRACDLVDEGEVVRVHISDRWIPCPNRTREQVVFLSEATGLISATLARVNSRRGTAVPAGVVSWGSAMHPAFTFPDLAANEVRERLGFKQDSLETIEGDLTANLLFPLRSRGSHLAASGAADDVRNGLPLRPHSTSSARLWAFEQAHQWAGIVP